MWQTPKNDWTRSKIDRFLRNKLKAGQNWMRNVKSWKKFAQLKADAILLRKRDKNIEQIHYWLDTVDQMNALEALLTARRIPGK